MLHPSLVDSFVSFKENEGRECGTKIFIDVIQIQTTANNSVATQKISTYWQF